MPAVHVRTLSAAVLLALAGHAAAQDPLAAPSASSEPYPIAADDGTIGSSNPSIAITPEGRSFTTWVGQLPWGQHQVYGVLRFGLQHGEYFEQPLQYGLPMSQQPQTAAAIGWNKDFLALWQSDPSMRPGISASYWYANYYQAGQSLSVGEPMSASFAHPTVAMDERYPHALMLWIEAPQPGLYLLRSAFAEAHDFNNSYLPGTVIAQIEGQAPARPAAALDAMGDGIVVWLAETAPGSGIDALHARKLHRYGYMSQSIVLATAQAGQQFSDPAIAMNRDGLLVLVWKTASDMDSDSAEAIVGRVFDFAGNPFGSGMPPMPISEFHRNGDFRYQFRNPDVAWDELNNVYVSWEQLDVLEEVNLTGQPPRYRSALARNPSGYWGLGEPAIANAGTDADAHGTQLAVDADGDATLVWTAVDSIGGQAAMGRRFAGLGMVDLSLMRSGVDAANPGDLANVSLQVQNHGQVDFRHPAINTASGIEIELDLPTGVSDVQVMDQHWRCETAERFRCSSKGLIAPGDSYNWPDGPVYLDLLMRMPEQSGPVDIAARVRSEQGELFTDNNAVNWTVQVGDITPDPMVLSAVTDVAIGSEQTSAEAVISGVGMPVEVSPWYATSVSINGGPFTTGPVMAGNGDRIRLRAEASMSYATTTWARANVGSALLSFQIVTADRDTSPEPFAFAGRSDVPRGSVQESEYISITGINAATPVSISGGSFAFEGGSWRTSAAHVYPWQRLRVRHTASSDFGAATQTVLTVGDTRATFVTTTEAADLTPDALAFESQTLVPRNSDVVSGELVIGGINDAASVSVANGSYSIDGGAFTSAAGAISAGQRIRVRHTSASTFNTATTTTLTVGTLSATFSSGTELRDVRPDPFAFVEQRDVQPGSIIESEPVGIAGINDIATVRVSNGSYSIDGGPYTSADGILRAGQTLRLSHRAAADYSMMQRTLVFVGDGFAELASRTFDADSVPESFALVDQTDAATGSTITSASFVVSGINVPAQVTATGGYFNSNGSSYANTGMVRNGDVVTVRHRSADTPNTTVQTTLTIGGIADTFSSTTGAVDTTPEAFEFTDVQGARRKKTVTSNALTITGINAELPLRVEGAGWYSINRGSWTNGPGIVRNGDSISLKLTASPYSNTTRSLTLYVGSRSDLWQVTTGSK